MPRPAPFPPRPFAILRHTLSLLSLLSAAAILGGCATVGGADPADAFVVLGEQGAVARVLTSAPDCPALLIDGRSVPTTLRAAAATIAQRPTASEPGESKASVFARRSCEAALPAGARSVLLAGRPLPLPVPLLRRIVVIGDTGCRIKGNDGTYQDCNNPLAYPFAAVAAAAAAWKPELVVHVGDYLYRENACPPGNTGCAGSPWGYGEDVWRADFFTPARPLLAAAPWVVARGNHEICRRGGQGYWRFLDPHPLLPGRDCNAAADDAIGDYAEPYAVALGDSAQLLVFDTANTSSKGFKPDDPRLAIYTATYGKLAALARRADYNIGVNHQPLLAFRGQRDANGGDAVLGGDVGLQQAFGAADPQLLPPAINALLSGHVHLWEQVSFDSAHPSQFVSGFSGTAEETVHLPAVLPPGASVAPGARVAHMSSWVGGFGFMTMERVGAGDWEVKVWGLNGALRNTCQLSGSKSTCALALVR